MKTLVVIRHGKSSWDHPELKDYHRPLKQRGVNNAFTVAKELIRREVSPDLMLSSPAIRALDTAIIIATNLQYPLEKISTDQNIYHASAQELLNVLSKVDDTNETVFFFGHNPAFTSLANRLQKEQLFNLPTCGAMGIELTIESWSDIGKASGKQLFKFIPKKLK